jgi:hypothetical protein
MIQYSLLIHLSVCPSRCRFWVSGPRRTDGQLPSFRKSPSSLHVCLSVCVWTKIGQCRGRQGRAGRPGKKTWEILGYGFQDMVFRTWDLNFGAWIFTLAVSKIETWKLLRRDFQDVGSQFWDLDFTQGASQGFTVAEGHGHPLVLYIKATCLSVRLLLPSFIYCLSEVTFFYLIYLNYFLLGNFCMCSNASHHVYVRSCFKYPFLV